MKMKKIGYLSLVLVLALSFLVSCAKPTTQPAAAASGDECF